MVLIVSNCFSIETTLGVIDPTGDRTLNLANVDGTLIPFAAASTTAISSTPGELNLLDGSGKSYMQTGGKFYDAGEYNPDVHGLPVPLVEKQKKQRSKLQIA